MSRSFVVSLMAGGLLLAACQDAAEKKSAESAAPATASTPAAAPVAAAKLYVQASSLKLRAEPRKDAKVRGRVAVNYPVEVLDKRDDFARVRVRNGKTGWVGAAFLGDKRVTRETAVELAQEAVDVKDRLTWLQRAAAVAPDDTDVLTKLRDTYGEVGNKRAAAMVDRLLKQKTRKWYPVPQGFGDEVWVEIQYAASQASETFDVPKDAWHEDGVSPGMELWVLPSHGAAVKGEVVAVRRTTWNECGGDVGIEARLAVTLPEGAKALVATPGPPPSSWNKAVAGVDGNAAKTAALAWFAENAGAEKTGGAEPSVAVAARGAGAHVQLALELGTDEEEMATRYRIIELRVDASGAVTKLADNKREEMFLTSPLGFRDVTGDGRLEIVTHDGCQTNVKTAKGEAFAGSSFRCCGC